MKECAIQLEEGALAQSEGRRADLVLPLDIILAECEATITRLAGLEQRGASQEGWVVTKL